MDDKRSCGGNAFQTVGLQRGNSVGRAVFLSKGQACRGVLPNEDLSDQKRLRLECSNTSSKGYLILIINK